MVFMSTQMSRLERMGAVGARAREVLSRMREGWTLMRRQSSWKRRAAPFLHRGPMMGGEEEKVTDRVLAELVEWKLVKESGELLNGWVVVYTETHE